MAIHLPSPSPDLGIDLCDTNLINLCIFCRHIAKYKCPRCRAPYCSLSCYKCMSHSDCSEKFYEQLCHDELRATKTDDVSRRKMIEILQREGCHVGDDEFELTDEEHSDDNDIQEYDRPSSNIADRLEGVDLDDANAVWSKLLVEEQVEFMKLIKSGQTENLIPPWEPWWLVQHFVEEVKDASDRDIPSFMKKSPQLVSCPSLSSVMKAKPSSLVPFNILNLLAAYVLVTHVFNGDHRENCQDATVTLLAICPVLSRGCCYDSAEIAVASPKLESQNLTWLRDIGNVDIEADVQKILTGPSPPYSSYYVQAALSDCHTLLNHWKEGRRRKRPAGDKDVFTSFICPESAIQEEKSVTKELVNKCIKKIEFFLSYIKEYPETVCVTR